MRYKICAVRDRAVDAYMTPFFVVSHGAAIRSFADEVNRSGENNQFNKHPDDFDLYSLGEYDDASGTFESHSPKMIAVGKELVR